MKKPITQHTTQEKNSKEKFFSKNQFVVLLFIVALATSFSTQLFSQDLQINFEKESNATIIKENNFNSTRIDYSFKGLNALSVDSEKGGFTELILPEGYSIGSLGTPKLPAAKHLIEVPFGADVSVKVTNYTVEEYKLSDYGISSPVFPVQPSLRKDQDPKDVPFEHKETVYAKNEFIEHEKAQIEVLGVLRGVRLARLTVAPVAYNPVEGIIRVYNNIEVELEYSGSDMELTKHIKASTYSPYFEVVYNQVINPFADHDIYDEYPDLTKEPVKMLIVSHRDFEASLQPFIEWKTEQGFYITEAYTDEIGTSASDIQTYIHDQYNAGTVEDPAPTFLIVVGDPGMLPASATGSSSGVVTDLYYASVDGDYFPEMYYGRLSARNVSELDNQINKILYYQKYEFDDPSYLNDVTLIAGSDGYWNPQVGQPTVQYGTENYFNAANGFVNVNDYLSSYSGCYDNERISVSFINYTAHCSPTSWGSPSLGVSDVHNMTNTGKYPLAVGNCCQSALFSSPESIGEAWVRAENKGGVAYVGSCPNTYWFDDFYWAVGAFPISGDNGGYVPTTEETTLGAYDGPFVSDYTAVGSLQFVGNLAVTVVDIENYPSHSSPTYYWQAYHTFGDPSTVIYLTEGDNNDVSHMAIVPIGMDFYTVAALPGSYVGISKDGILHGAAFVDESGEVDVPIDPILDGGDVTIVVTKPQRIPYIATVPAAALEGPFVVLEEFVINDVAETHQANYGESFTIDVTLKNVGADAVGEVTATLSGTDTYINLLDGDTPVTFDAMAAGDAGNTATVEDAFSFEIANDVPDQHKATFILTITDGEEEWISNLSITANAPVFVINPEYALDDNDGNGRLDPGESATLTYEIKNNGNAKAKQPFVELAGNSPYFAIDNPAQAASAIEPGETIEVVFNVNANASSPEGTLVDLYTTVEDGHWDEADSQITIGQSPEIIIGDGSSATTYYPFYNWYKANRSQMLYKAEEIGLGEKTIKELGMDFVHLTSTPEHQALPNFKILIKHTDISSVGSSYVNMDDAVLVFDGNNYQMPTEDLGWHMWDIEDFEYDGESNLIIEVIWGLLDSYCQSGDYYSVNGTDQGENRVAYGYDDNQASPDHSDSSSLLPNLYLAFAAEETEEEKGVTFLVKNTDEDLVEEAEVLIGSLAQNTDVSGVANYLLMPGEYDFEVSKDTYQDYFGDFTLTSQDINITVILLKDGEVSAPIVDNSSQKVKVYPNPARGYVNIELSGFEGKTKMTLMNYQGQLISQQSFDVDSFGIKQRKNLGDLPRGVYYLKVQSGDFIQISKIVLQ